MKDRRYAAAKKRVKQIKEFYTHFVVYVAIMIMLLAIDLLDGTGGGLAC